MRYFTSDLHFFHNLVHRKYRNKYSTIHDMNNSIIEMWNKKVKSKDTVYIIGDVTFGKYEQTKELISKLNGIKILIRGNHDERFTSKTFISMGFDDVRDLHEIKIDGQKVLLCHFPYSSSFRYFYYKLFGDRDEAKYYKRYLSYKGYPLIHGHHHEQKENYFNQINVTYDVNKTLLSELDIKDILEEYDRNSPLYKLLQTIKAILW